MHTNIDICIFIEQIAIKNLEKHILVGEFEEYYRRRLFPVGMTFRNAQLDREIEDRKVDYLYIIYISKSYKKL